MIVTDSVLQNTSISIGIFPTIGITSTQQKKIILNRGKHELKEFVYLHHRSYSERASEGELAKDTCISYTLRRISSTRYLRNVIYLAVSYRVGGPVVKMRYERLELPTPVSALKHRWNNRNSATPMNSTTSSSDRATKTPISHRGYVYHLTVQNVLVST